MEKLPLGAARKAIIVIEEIAGAGSSLSEIPPRVGIAKGTVHRLVAILQDEQVHRATGRMPSRR